MGSKQENIIHIRRVDGMIKYVVTGILAAPSGAAVFVLQKKIVYPKIHDLLFK